MPKTSLDMIRVDTDSYPRTFISYTLSFAPIALHHVPTILHTNPLLLLNNPSQQILTTTNTHLSLPRSHIQLPPNHMSATFSPLLSLEPSVNLSGCITSWRHSTCSLIHGPVDNQTIKSSNTLRIQMSTSVTVVQIFI